MAQKGQETTTKFKVDISELKSEIKEAQRQIRLANSEFKAASSGMEDWGKTADGLSAKVKQLDSTLSAQKTVLSSLEKQYKNVAESQGENSQGAQELLIKINNQKAAVNKTQVELDKYNKALGDVRKGTDSFADGTESVISASDKLKNTINDQQGELEQLKKVYQDIVLEQGESSLEAGKYAEKIKNLASELNGNKKAYEDSANAAEELTGATKDAGSAAEKAEGGFSVLRGALASLLADGVKAAINGIKDLGTAALDAYKDFDTGADNVIMATGTIGKAGEELEESYRNVAKSVVGNFGDIGNALGEVNTRFGFTGEKLEDATEKFIKFADITGTDAKTAIQLVSRAMGDAGIPAEQYGEVLDQLTVAAQASGISVDSLTGNLAKYGAPMRAIGMDTKESIAIFAGWEKAGVNTEIAFSGMKKAIGTWGKEGKDAREEFTKTLDEIANAPDIANATAKAIEIFGQKAGPDLADAIQSGRFDFSEMLDLIESSGGVIENTYAATQDGLDKIQLGFQNARVEIASIVGDLLNDQAPMIDEFVSLFTDGVKDLAAYINQHMPEIKTVISNVINGIIGGIKTLIENKDLIIGAIKAVIAVFAAIKIVSFIGQIMNLFTAVKTGIGVLKGLNIVLAANPIGIVVTAIGALAAAFIYLWNTSDDFRNFWIGLWDGVRNTFMSAWDGIVNFFTVTIPQVFNTVIDFVKNNWQSLLLLLVNPFAGAFKLLYDNCSGFRDTVDQFIQAIIGFFRKLPENIANIAKSAMNHVSNWGKQLYTFATTTIPQFILNVIQFFGQLPGKIWDLLVQAYNKVVAWGANLIEKGRTAASDTVNNIISGFTGLPGRLQDAGRNALEGFWNGLKSVGENIKRWASNFFGGIIDTAKSVLRIASPSKALKQLGKYTMEGYGEGTEKEGKKVLSNVKRIFRSVIDAGKAAIDVDSIFPKSQTGTAQAGGSLSGGQTIINNNFTQNNTSPKSLSRLDIYRQTKNLVHSMA